MELLYLNWLEFGERGGKRRSSILGILEVTITPQNERV